MLSIGIGKESATTFSWEFHSKCAVAHSFSDMFYSSGKEVIMLGYPEEEEGKHGVCNQK